MPSLPITNTTILSIVLLLLPSLTLTLQLPTTTATTNTSSLPPSPPTNCHGSFFCLFYTGADFILKAFQLATVGILPRPTSAGPDWNLGPLNESSLYAPPNHILCLPLGPRPWGGFCVFAHGGGAAGGGEVYVSGKTVTDVLGLLVRKGCRMCGSVWVGDGGWVTVNYVGGKVCKGVCPEARYY